MTRAHSGLTPSVPTEQTAKPVMGRRGRLPFGEAQNLDDAAFCLRYILGQIEGCNTYRPNIGQVNSATSGIRIALDGLRQAEIMRAALERIATVDMGGGFLGALACRQVAAEALSTPTPSEAREQGEG